MLSCRQTRRRRWTRRELPGSSRFATAISRRSYREIQRGSKQRQKIGTHCKITRRLETVGGILCDLAGCQGTQTPTPLSDYLSAKLQSLGGLVSAGAKNAQSPTKQKKRQVSLPLLMAYEFFSYSFVSRFFGFSPTAIMSTLPVFLPLL